ncbi:MAG: DedD protein [Sulfurimonas sp.]|jgi:DedD protein|uniref:SPOR domain-containing protein n=1 Tax=Sulfurimonas sp. TaxID=2022749 RepID=UPI0039E4679C
MNESNELNDIILNKSGPANNNKKIILAVATLGVILIVVVMLMNSLTSTGTDNLPQTPLPPEPQTQASKDMTDEPLFEEVEVMQEESQSADNLDEIARKLKEESQEAQVQEVEIVEEPIIVQKRKTAVVKAKTVIKPKPKPVVKTTTSVSTSKNYYYIQVGSFSKYAPNKKFLGSITNLGYKYKFHKVTKNGKSTNKVLVGPFKSSVVAKDARRVLRTKVEPGAFLIKL